MRAGQASRFEELAQGRSVLGETLPEHLDVARIRFASELAPILGRQGLAHPLGNLRDGLAPFEHAFANRPSEGSHQLGGQRRQRVQLDPGGRASTFQGPLHAQRPLCAQHDHARRVGELTGLALGHVDTRADDLERIGRTVQDERPATGSGLARIGDPDRTVPAPRGRAVDAHDAFCTGRRSVVELEPDAIGALGREVTDPHLAQGFGLQRQERAVASHVGQGRAGSHA